MEFLRPQFESAIEPLLDRGVVKIGRFEYTGAEIIKLAGDVAYKQAFGESPQSTLRAHGPRDA